MIYKYNIYRYNITEMYNKFQKTNISKFGAQNINYGSGLTPIMVSGLATAIPIWELLKITEEQ